MNSDVSPPLAGRNGSRFSPLRRLTPRQRRFYFIAIILAVLLGGGWWLIFSGLPNAEEIRAYQPESTAQPGNINWERRFTSPIRLWTPASKISNKLKQAVIVSEDDLFYQHDGLNLDMMKESFEKNLAKGRYVRGASTITMQFARNAFLRKQKTLRRKVREIILTRRIEKTLSKDRILELYLNIIEWGEGIYGAEAAARFYFGKSAAHLDWAEASLLAGMLPNPKYFNPYKRMKACQRMQKRVLWLLQLHHHLTAEQAQALEASGVHLAQRGAAKALPPEVETAAGDTLEAAELLRTIDSLATPPSTTPAVEIPQVIMMLDSTIDSLNAGAQSDSSALKN